MKILTDRWRYNDYSKDRALPKGSTKTKGGNMADKRGFASMDKDKQRAIASKGGKASGGNFANDRQKASTAGRKGGQISRRS